MNSANFNLHGSAPDASPLVLLLIDVINDLDFPESHLMLDAAREMAENLLELKRWAARHGVPAVYVNDNFGRWQSDFRRIVQHCQRKDAPGAEVSRILEPAEEDYFVLKPKHSGFFSTTLDLLLRHLAARTLILTGIAGNLCVLYTANDAYMRDYELLAPADCTVSNTKQDNDYALAQMKRFHKADIRPWREAELDRRIGEAKAIARGGG